MSQNTSDDYTIPADLTIPWFLDMKNPDVQAEHQLARELPLVAAVRVDTKAPRNLDAETQAFLEAEREREKGKAINRIAKMKAKKTTQAEIKSGKRWDTVRAQWVADENIRTCTL